MREEISLNYQNNDLLSKLSSRGLLRNIGIEIMEKLAMKDLKAAELTCSSWRKLIIEEEIFQKHLGNIFIDFRICIWGQGAFRPFEPVGPRRFDRSLS